jgi:hypothetical protein
MPRPPGFSRRPAHASCQACHILCEVYQRGIAGRADLAAAGRAGDKEMCDFFTARKRALQLQRK